MPAKPRHATKLPRRLIERYLAARDASGDAPGDAPGEARDGRLSNPQRELRRLKNRLVEAALPLAAYGADAICANPPPPLTRDDVLSWAHEGLLSAVDTYSPDRGARFETYAISKARWAVLDGLRRQDPLPRSVRDPVARAAASRQRLASLRGRVPTTREVAKDAGLTVARLDALALRVLHAAQIPLDAPAVRADPAPAGLASVGEGRLIHEMLADAASENPQQSLIAAELREGLLRAISTLPQREGRVVEAYFYEGCTLREIGAEIGLTEGRVSQILKAALATLRATLSASPNTPPRHGAGPVEPTDTPATHLLAASAA